MTSPDAFDPTMPCSITDGPQYDDTPLNFEQPQDCDEYRQQQYDDQQEFEESKLGDVLADIGASHTIRFSL